MSKKLKIILFASGGFVGLLAIIAAALYLFLDINAYKQRIETGASQALGMEFKIGGPLSIGFLPNTHVALRDVSIRNHGVEIASAKETMLGIDFLPLLRKEIRIGRIILKQPKISIERDAEGKFNFEKSEKESYSVDLAQISFTDGSLVYLDKKTEERIEAVNCKLDMDRLRFSKVKNSPPLKNLSLTAKFSCDKIQTNDAAAFDLKLSAQGEKGVVDIKPITMRIFDGQGSGSLRAVFSDDAPRFNLRYSLAKFRVEEFLKIWSPQKVAEGTANFSANLSMHGKITSEMTQNIQGDIALQGENLTFIGSNLDREFARFEASQSFNLVDAGAVFFAGPLGLVVTKGYNFANILRKSEGNSNIRLFVSNWKVENGVAQAQDVAMSTDHNRMALTGKLDLVNQRFDDVTMALIDDKGCAKVRQKIKGTFQKPVVEKPGVLKSIAGPAIKLLKKGKELLGGECEVFYAGSVTPPSK